VEVASGPPTEVLGDGTSWPEGWIKMTRKRLGGSSAGTFDSYWISPVEKVRLRSIPEVRKFLGALKAHGGDEKEARKLFRRKPRNLTPLPPKPSGDFVALSNGGKTSLPAQPTASVVVAPSPKVARIEPVNVPNTSVHNRGPSAHPSLPGPRRAAAPAPAVLPRMIQTGPSWVAPYNHGRPTPPAQGVIVAQKGGPSNVLFDVHTRPRARPSSMMGIGVASRPYSAMDSDPARVIVRAAMAVSASAQPRKANNALSEPRLATTMVRGVAMAPEYNSHPAGIASARASKTNAYVISDGSMDRIEFPDDHVVL